MGLGDLVDDKTDSGTEKESESSPSGSSDAHLSSSGGDNPQHDTTDVGLEGYTHWTERWDGPTHSLPSTDERRTSEGYKRLDDATAGHRECSNFLIEYNDDGVFMGPDPPSDPDRGELPHPGDDDWHEKWVDYTDKWSPKLLSEKQAECRCGNHVWMKRRVAWLRCAKCHRVLVDTEWYTWTEEIQVKSGTEKETTDSSSSGLARLADF